MSKPLIVCICGSMQFETVMRGVAAEKTSQDYIVVMPHKVTQNLELKKRLDQLHMQKIALADEVVIVNVGGYMGESTMRELAYARELGKPISFYEDR